MSEPNEPAAVTPPLASTTTPPPVDLPPASEPAPLEPPAVEPADTPADGPHHVGEPDGTTSADLAAANAKIDALVAERNEQAGRLADLEADLGQAEDRAAAAEERIAARQHDAQAAFDAGANADVSDQYDPAVAYSSVVCPSCGNPVPVAPPTEEVTDASQA